EILRAAFDATMKDPGFLKDMKKSRLSVQPTSGAKVQQLIRDIYLSDPATQKLARAAISKSK
ncbi:MAG: hypothetical protein O3C49_02920, partial [Proteobacteria bacterium]|nr:hypothetical protein [Pseudomonadota bacterium]